MIASQIPIGAALAVALLCPLTLPAQGGAAPHLVELQRTVHFTGADGSRVTVQRGKYRLEAAGDEQLRLLPEKGQPVVLDASLETHDRELTQPDALAFRGGMDVHYLAVELPDGRRVAAVGSYSGLVERGGPTRTRLLQKPGQPVAGNSTPKRYFEQFNPNASGHDWANQYILALLAHFAYDSSVGAKNGNFTDFRKHFKRKLEPWGAEIDDPGDFIDTRGRVFEHTQVAIVTLPTAVIVTFRGSESSDAVALFRDWIVTDANMLWTELPSYSRAGFMAPRVRVHTGFWNGVNSCWSQLLRKLKPKLAGGRRKLFLTGHSLGGALATLAAIRLAREEKIPVQGVHTYASPRVGNDEFRVVYHATQHLRKTQRWVNGLDLVPMFPPGFPLQVPTPPLMEVYRHVGQSNNIHLPLLGKQTDCRIKLGDKTEIVGVGNVGRHGMHLYAQSIYHKLPARLRAMLPKPPKE
ncbi:MAG: lipase family protein [Planctomycetes bacterium]|nr:lipase family protein [Planctomycetota bacterium]